MTKTIDGQEGGEVGEAVPRESVHRSDGAETTPAASMPSSTWATMMAASNRHDRAMPDNDVREAWLSATDLSRASDRAVMEAARLVHALHGCLYVLHAFPPSSEHGDEQGRERDDLQQREVRRCLDRLAWLLRGRFHGLEVHADVVAGEPVETILAEAGRVGAARIVLGTPRRSGAAHHPGSVAERVVLGARIPVFVVKPSG